jgi:hypothetical protein
MQTFLDAAPTAREKQIGEQALRYRFGLITNGQIRLTVRSSRNFYNRQFPARGRQTRHE